MKHTPAPWTRTAGERFKHDQSAGIKGPNGLYIACALDMNRTDKDEEVEANAQLIAMAPELLEALKACRAYLIGEFTKLDLVETIEKADSAIAKAGQS